MKETALTDGQRLQTVLDLLRISANKLATIIKVTPASIYHITAGRNSLSQDLIEKIIKEFDNVNYSYLRAGKGNPLLSTDEEKRTQRALFLDPGQKSMDIEAVPTTQKREEEKEVLSSILSHQIQELIYQQRKGNELLEALVRENKEIKELLASKI